MGSQEAFGFLGKNPTTVVFLALLEQNKSQLLGGQHPDQHPDMQLTK